MKTIESLKEKVAQSESQISALTDQLAAANVRIEQLGNQVDSLNVSVANEKLIRNKLSRLRWNLRMR